MKVLESRKGEVFGVSIAIQRHHVYRLARDFDALLEGALLELLELNIVLLGVFYEFGFEIV